MYSTAVDVDERKLFFLPHNVHVHDSDVSTTYRFSFRFHFDMMMLLFLGAECESRQKLFSPKIECRMRMWIKQGTT